MSDKDNKTDQVEDDKNFKVADTAVFHKVRRFGKVKLLGLLALVVILIAAVMLFVQQSQPALQVGKYSYSKEKYEQLISQAADIKVGESDARKALTKALASKEAADRVKVTYPTDTANLNEAARYEYKLGQDSKAKISDYQRETAAYRIVEANIRFATTGGYKATVVHVPFARYIYGFELNSKTALNGNPDLVGDETAIYRDMGYTFKKAEELKQAYDSKQKTAAEVIKAALDDPIASYGKGPRASNSVLVGRDQLLRTYGDESLSLPTDQFKLIEAGKDQLGKTSNVVEELVSIEGLNVPTGVMRGDQAAVGYYFVIVDEVVQARSGLQGEYDKLVKELQ
jgi:hypothetical protein